MSQHVMSLEGQETVTVREFEQADIADAHAISMSVGWSQRLEDWQWLGATCGGLVATQRGKVVGTTLHWDYENDFSSVGAVMVDPGVQGAGIGRRLMEACLKKLQGRSLLLHATPAGLPLYEKLGFVPGGGLSQFEGKVTSILPAISPDHHIVPLSDTHTDVIVQIAERASGIRRASFIRSVIQVSDGAVIIENDLPCGFALIRRYGKGWGMGPVVASRESAAASLILELLRNKVGEHVRMDATAHAGSQLEMFLNDSGLHCVSTAVPMVRGEWPLSDHAVRQFGIVTQATG